MIEIFAAIGMVIIMLVVVLGITGVVSYAIDRENIILQIVIGVVFFIIMVVVVYAEIRGF